MIVAIHHPPFSGDSEHSGSAAAEKVLFQSFAPAGRHPHLILSGHVHNYQRFTVKESAKNGPVDVACVVSGNGGYSKLGKLHKINGNYPPAPMQLSDTLSLDKYDQDNFGFLRFEVTKNQIVGTCLSALYDPAKTSPPNVTDKFTINLQQHKIS